MSKVLRHREREMHCAAAALRSLNGLWLSLPDNPCSTNERAREREKERESETDSKSVREGTDKGGWAGSFGCCGAA